MLTEKDITNEKARELRKSLNLSQAAFWSPIGVLQSVGARYEDDVRIPRSVRILIVTKYCAGLQIDAGTESGVKEIARLASIQTGGVAVKDAFQALSKASDLINKAQASLEKL